MEKMKVELSVDSSTWVIVEWRVPEGSPHWNRQPYPVFFAAGMGGKKDKAIENLCERHSREQRAAGNDVHVAAYMVASNLKIPALVHPDTFILIDNDSIPLGTETAEEVAA